MKRILVTGASGFVGGELCRVLAERGWTVRMALRRNRPGLPDYDRVQVGEIGPQTDWAPALAGVDAVVHLAARVHMMRDAARDADSAFARVNALGTERLAQQAATAGVRRLVYVSSVKVNGELTKGRPFTELDPADPQDAYGRSKAVAESALRAVSAESGIETVVVRPPMVYGPGVSGNLGRILRAIRLGLPLPLGAIHNRRSLVGLWGLADLLAICVEHPAAAGETFLAADRPDLSTADLVRLLAAGCGRRARLFPVPAGLLRGVGTLLGRRGEVERLCGDLQVDADKARRLLGWEPRLPLERGLELTAKAFLQHPDALSRH